MEPFLYAGITLAFFTVIFMISKQPRHLSDKVFSIWMIFLALPLISRLLTSEFHDIIPPGPFSITCYPLAFGPFLWLYVIVLTNENARIKRGYILHFVPFVAFALLQALFPEAFLFPGSKHYHPPTILHNIYVAATLLSLVGYILAVLILMRRHKNRALDYFSNITTHITLRWLHWLTIIFAVTYLTILLSDVLLPNFDRPFPLFPGTFHALAFTFFIFVFSFFGLKQPLIFKPPERTSGIIEESRSQETSTKKIPEPKYEKSGLKEEQARVYLQMLEAHMKQEQPYLDANLTITNLAKQLHIPKHYLTQVINEQLKKNFYSYVNEYRVNVLKQRIVDPKYAHLNLLTIAYESGFNSKSSFNNVFKKYTNMTPSQFRKTNALKKKED